MFKLIDVKTNKVLKRAKHAFNLFEYMDQLIANGYDSKLLKIIL